MLHLVEWIYLQLDGNLAFYDRQTKVFNRNWWEYSSRQKYQKKEIYLTMIDLNGLKSANDTLGHEAGDRKILRVVDLINSTFEKKILCRLGGDEFLLLTKNNPEAALTNISTLGDFSFGVYHKKAEEEISVALKKADELMYAMKRNCPNRR